jgi:hypothetical protein
MNQGPRRISLMEKKEDQKSRGTIPLRDMVPDSKMCNALP